MQGLRAVYPEPGMKGAVEVLPADLARLDDGEFLNDTIIDFWMRCASFALSLSAARTLGLGSAM